MSSRTETGDVAIKVIDLEWPREPDLVQNLVMNCLKLSAISTAIGSVFKLALPFISNRKMYFLTLPNFASTL